MISSGVVMDILSRIQRRSLVDSFSGSGAAFFSEASWTGVFDAVLALERQPRVTVDSTME